MNWGLLAARLVLSAVFIAAGSAKLADRDGTARAVADFGVPEKWSPALARAVPFAELTVGVALIPLASATAAAVAGLVLLLAFTAAVGAAMARGEAPDCHCFGRLHSAPVGRRTLLRNVALIGLAGFVAVEGWGEPGASGVAWLGRLDAKEVAALVAGCLLAAAVAGLGWFCLQLLRQNGRILLRLGELEASVAASEGGSGQERRFGWEERPLGLAVGSPAPAFLLDHVDGSPRSLASLLAEHKPVVLVFTDPACGACETLLPEVGRWQREHAAGLAIVVVTRGDLPQAAAAASRYELVDVLFAADGGAAGSFGASRTPAAVLVLADGTIGSALAPGTAAVAELVGRAAVAARTPLAGAGGRSGAGDPVGAPPPPDIPVPGAERIGLLAPSFELADTAGAHHSVAAPSAHGRLLLFFDPRCAFCQAMLPELAAFEADPPAGSPEVAVIVNGDTDLARRLELRSLVLADPDARAAAAFGFRGTPMAVLLDGEARISSPVAVGAREVLALAGAGERRRSPAG